MSCGAMPFTDTPSTVMSPESAAMKPEMVFISVLLPAPFGPMTAVICPSGTSTFTSDKALSPPNALLTSLRPPERTPPRLGSLSKAQETVVLRVLDVLAHSGESGSMDLAAMVLSEWWTPGAIAKDLDD